MNAARQDMSDVTPVAAMLSPYGSSPTLPTRSPLTAIDSGRQTTTTTRLRFVPSSTENQREPRRKHRRARGSPRCRFRWNERVGGGHGLRPAPQARWQRCSSAECQRRLQPGLRREGPRQHPGSQSHHELDQRGSRCDKCGGRNHRQRRIEWAKLAGACGLRHRRILVTNFGNHRVTLFRAADLSRIGNVALPAGSGPYGACSDGINFFVTLRGAKQLLRI